MNGAPYPAVTDTDYPAVRRVMGELRNELGDTHIEDLLVNMFPESAPSEVEDFMRSLQRFGKQVAPLAQRALPAVIQGAATGASVGGPWGALIGAAGGGASSLLQGAPPSGKTAASNSATAAATASRSSGTQAASSTSIDKQPYAPNVSPAGVATKAAGATVAAPATVGNSTSTVAAPVTPAVPAAQLLQLIARPETMQALLAMLMAGAGRPTVPVGERTVPAEHFAEAIAELAQQTVGQHISLSTAAATEYLLDDLSNPRADLSDPAQRASLLLADLAAAQCSAQRQPLSVEPLAWSVPAEGDLLDHAGDPFEQYEAALEGRDPDDY